MTFDLDKAASAATLVLCAVAVVTLVHTQMTRDVVAAPQLPTQKGEILDGLGALVPEGADSAVVVALAPDCGYCLDSYPFYRQLAEARRAGRLEPALVATVGSDDALAQERSSLEDAGIHFDDLRVADFQALRLVGTPTVLHVDPAGRILDVWIGLLNEDRQSEVLDAIGTRL
ncbi:MAG: hypothetical protein AAGN66_24275 [Acidobacteriota bacterium]